MASQNELALIADRIRQLAPATETHNGKMLGSVHRMTCEADQRGAFADVRLAPLRDYFDDRLERRPFGSASWNMFAALHWLADNAAAIGVAYPTNLPSIAIKHWCLAFPKADCVRPHVHAFADLIEAAGRGCKREVVSTAKRGRKPATDDEIKEACEVWIEYQRSDKGPKEFCEWRNGDKKVGRVGVKWLNAKLALVRKYRSESPERIPKRFANKFKPLRRVKRAV